MKTNLKKNKQTKRLKIIATPLPLIDDNEEVKQFDWDKHDDMQAEAEYEREYQAGGIDE